MIEDDVCDYPIFGLFEIEIYSQFCFRTCKEERPQKSIVSDLMTIDNSSQDCRQALAAAFKTLSDEAVEAGWPEGEVALALAELAEAHVAEIGAKVIVEGFNQLQLYAAAGRRKI